MTFYEKLLRKAASKEQRRLWKHTRAMNGIGLGPKGPRKKPPETGIAVPAVPPQGPLPLQGGAQVPLTFD